MRLISTGLQRPLPSFLALILLTTPALAGPDFKTGVSVTVRERDGLDRVAEPTRFAFPFAKKDKFKKPHKLVVLNQDGEIVPSQARVTQRWKGAPENSKKPIRWLLIDIQADVEAFGETTYTVRKLQKKTDVLPEAPTLNVSVVDNRVRAETGAAIFELGGDRHAFLEQLSLDIDGNGVIDEELESFIASPADAGFVLTDRFGATYSSADHDFTAEIEEEGPLRTVVKVSGRHGPTSPADGIGRDFFKYVTRYTFFAGKPYVQVTHSLRNSYRVDPLGSIGFEGYALQTSLVTGQSASATFGVADADLSQSFNTTGALRLYQDSDGGDNWGLSPNTTFRGFRVYDGADGVVHDGDQAAGYLHVGDGHRGVTMAVADFFANFPKGLTYDGDKTFRLEFFPEETASFFWLDDAQQKTSEFILYGHVDPTRTPADVASHYFKPLRPFTNPKWVRKSKAWADQGDLDDPPQDDETLWSYDDGRLDFVYEDAFNQKSFAYGWSEFGELIWAKNTHTTGSPRNRLSYFDRFMINGSPSFFRINELFVLHSRDLRTYHIDGFSMEKHPYAVLWEAMPPWKFSDDKLGRDSLDPSLDAHRAGIPVDGHGWNAFDFEHMVVDDLYEYHLLTGDPISKECVLEIAECIRTFLIYDKKKGPTSTRGIGWALRALVKAYQLTGDKRFLDSGGDLVLATYKTYNRKIASPITGKIYHWVTRYPPVAKHIPDAEFEMPWQMGPMIHGLFLYYRETGDKKARKIALDAADWLVDYAWKKPVMPDAVANDDHKHINPLSDNNGVNTWLPSALALAYREGKRPEYLAIATLIYNSVPSSLKDWNSWIGWSNYHWWHSYLAVLAKEK